MKLFIHKWTHWEYWPAWMVYFPVGFLWVYYSLRSKTLFFFSTVNPTFRNSGFMNVSKKAIYDLMPFGSYPKTILVENSQQPAFHSIKNLDALSFPLIVKPDKGLRGALVKKLTSMEALETYHNDAHFDYLIQDYIEYPLEAGIFYIRKPNETNGIITGIVEKEFLTIVGDGVSNIEELLKKKPRYEFQLSALKKEHKETFKQILAMDEKKTLVPFGNHCKGAMFVNANSHITPELVKTINTLCHQVDGFYYGRIDIKFRDWEALNRGEHFSIIEINGAMSEPAHIYDPKNTYLNGIKEIFRHYQYLFEISQLNKTLGFRYLTFQQGLQELREHFATVDKYSKA